MVRVVPNSVALGEQRCLTVQVQQLMWSISFGVHSVGHPNLSFDDLNVPGDSTVPFPRVARVSTAFPWVAAGTPTTTTGGISLTAAIFAEPPLASSVVMR